MSLFHAALKALAPMGNKVYFEVVLVKEKRSIRNIVRNIAHWGFESPIQKKQNVGTSFFN